MVSGAPHAGIRAVCCAGQHTERNVHPPPPILSPVAGNVGLGGQGVKGLGARQLAGDTLQGAGGCEQRHTCEQRPRS